MNTLHTMKTNTVRFDYAFQGGPRDGWHGVDDVLMDRVVTPEGEVYQLGVETAIGTRMKFRGVWVYSHVPKAKEGLGRG